MKRKQLFWDIKCSASKTSASAGQVLTHITLMMNMVELATVRITSEGNGRTPFTAFNKVGFRSYTYGLSRVYNHGTLTGFAASIDKYCLVGCTKPKLRYMLRVITHFYVKSFLHGVHVEGSRKSSPSGDC